VSTRAVWFDETSTEPELLSANREIRHAAGQIYYLDNTFAIAIRDFNPSVLLRLKRRLKAVSVNWERFWKDPRHAFVYTQRRPVHSWGNLKHWLKLYGIDLFELRFTFPHAVQGHGREARGWFVIGAMFHLAARLRGQPWGLVEDVLENQRFVLAGVINRAEACDRALIPLILTPPSLMNPDGWGPSLLG
jgi:hypothetical protein